MIFPPWLDNLIAYSLQMAILASVGTLLVYLFRLRMPRVTHIYWQVLLIACLMVPIFQSWQRPVYTIPKVTGTFVSTPIPMDPAAVNPESAFRIRPEILVAVLAAGAFIRLLWLAIGFFRLRHIRNNSRWFTDEPAMILEMQLKTGVRASVHLSPKINSPVTFGYRTPVVILPPSFPGMSESCRRSILCHELLHVRRKDWLSTVIEEIVRSVFWFHPAVWWLLGRIHLSREQVVDHEVVRLIGNRQPYLDSLLEIAQTRARLKAVPAPLFLRESHFIQRVTLLLKEASMSRTRLLISLAGIAVLLIGTVQIAAAWFPLTGSPIIVEEETVDMKSTPARPIHSPSESDGVVGGSAGGIAGGIPGGVVGGVAGSKAPTTTKPDIKVFGTSPTPDGIVGGIPGGVTGGTQGDIPGGVVGNLLSNMAKTAPPPPPKPRRRDPIKIGGNFMESKLMRKIEPAYPELAKRTRTQGNVILIVTVDEEGNVADIKVSGGHPLLNDAAVNAVKQWKYSPTLLNGVPVPVITTVTVAFRLDAGQGSMRSPVDEPGNLSENPKDDEVSQRRPIRVGGNVMESKLIRRVPPIYPDLAKATRVQGIVVLVVTVNKEGEVSSVQVAKGHPLLNEAAVTAVKQWRYSPTLLNGAPVPAKATVTVDFRLAPELGTISVMIDPSGNLMDLNPTDDSRNVMERMKESTDPIIVLTKSDTPIRIAQNTLDDLVQQGIQNIHVTGYYRLYQGHLFYPADGSITPPKLALDPERLRNIATESGRLGEFYRPFLQYFVYVNEAGEIVGIQNFGPEIPELEDELMNTPVISPGLLGNVPVPVQHRVIILLDPEFQFQGKLPQYIPPPTPQPPAPAQ